MQRRDSDPIDAALDLYRDLIRRDVRLEAELASTARDFFGHRAGAPGSTAPDELALRRQLEWFLLERPSLHLRRIPIDALEDDFEEEAGAEESGLGAILRSSLASVFEVTGVEAGRGVWLRDLAGFGEYPIDEPKASALIEVGDLIVGRVFPSDGSVYRISRAAGFFRNPILRDALRKDFERARASRRGVLRVAQSELESMFWGSQAPAAEPGSGDPVGDARRALARGGLTQDEIERLLKQLASVPFDPDRLVVGAGDVLGGILDQLAFETTIDLGGARELLLRAWEALTRPAGAAASDAARLGTPGSNGASKAVANGRAGRPVDVADAIAAFDRGRAEGGDLDELFDALERDLQLDRLDADDADDADEDAASGADEGTSAPAPDFPGVVGAMVEEYLWETSLESAGTSVPEATPDQGLLRTFGRFAAPIGVFENLRARDLLVYTSYWLPESGVLANADQARGLLAALKGFCRWAEEKQEVKLFSDFRDTLDSLRSSLPRVIEANRRRTRKAERSRGELHECIAGDDGRIARLRDHQGHEHDADLDPWLASWLQEGDRVRARLDTDGRAAVYCCYPPEIAGVANELSGS